jgi:uncharacterized phage protein (TIGR02220 family)
MKEAYYFSHDANARQDEKILMLRAEHGWEGYGIYWALVEMMFESTESVLHHSKIKGISVSYNIDIAVLKEIINTCIQENLFQTEGDLFWSESLVRRKEKFREVREKRSEAGKKGAAKRWGDNESNSKAMAEPSQSDSDDIAKNSKEKESKEKEKESKEEKIPYDGIIEYLNEKSGKSYKSSTKKTQTLIKARLNEGFTLHDIRDVIDIKCSQWKNDPQMNNYLRPETLFGTKFEGYLNEKPKTVSSLSGPRGMTSDQRAHLQLMQGRRQA